MGFYIAPEFIIRREREGSVVVGRADNGNRRAYSTPTPTPSLPSGPLAWQQLAPTCVSRQSSPAALQDCNCNGKGLHVVFSPSDHRLTTTLSQLITRTEQF